MDTYKIRKEFEGALTEIGAGMVLIPKTEADHAWNNACERSKRIVSYYIRGEGLFQLTAVVQKEETV